MNVRRVLDWKFVVAVTVASMVAYLIFTGYAAVREAQAKGDRIDALIAATREQAREAAEGRERARDERSELLEQIKVLQHNQTRILAKLPPERGTS